MSFPIYSFRYRVESIKGATSGGLTMTSGSSQAAMSASKMKPFLRRVGYKESLLQSDFAFGDGKTVPLVAFAHKPVDARTACIAVIDAVAGSPELVAQYRSLATPIVLVCGRNGLEWWKQTPELPIRQVSPVHEDNLEAFFTLHSLDFGPAVVYRAKTWGRFNDSHQLSFVDLGLMPLVEKEIGKDLERLIVRNVAHLKSQLGWDTITDKQGQWLLQSVFWIVSAKMLRDKHVARFTSVDPDNVNDLLSAVANHFGASPIPINTQREREALSEVAHVVSNFSNLGLATTESLAFVYENALISKSTRQALGTHSTPSFLVDYVVGKLAPWIAEIPLEKRNVFEPACGHAAFLVSAMRLLTELLPDEKSTPSQRHDYLRSRIHGIERDVFALEIARLSLSLTDIPNPNGWNLVAHDMFLGDDLEKMSRNATICLTNPPFENFGIEDRVENRDRNERPQYVNKTAEVLSRVLSALPSGAVFGAVVPQGFLNNKNCKAVRKYLIDNFEIKEVSLFPDKVFEFSDSESAVLIARKQNGDNGQVRYRRVRERDMEAFRQDYRVTTDLTLSQSQFTRSYDLRVPDLEQVWSFCEKWNRFGGLAEIGQGFTFKGRNLSSGTITFSERAFDGAQPGFLTFPRKALIHESPPTRWLNLNDNAIRCKLHGTRTGVSQVILNEAPTSRGPWRLKALIDAAGHPVTGRFNVVRPFDAKRTPLDFLWALCNSPVANAYAYCHAGKRHNDAGMLRQIPIPSLSDSAVHAIALAARRYLDYVSGDGRGLRATIDADRARELILRMDNEVLKLYDLPLELERQLLLSFDGWPRSGLPFRFERYFPENFTDSISLTQYLAITADWPDINRERALLIRKSISGGVTSEEVLKLDQLQHLAELRRRLVAPLPITQLETQYRELTEGSGK